MSHATILFLLISAPCLEKRSTYSLSLVNDMLWDRAVLHPIICNDKHHSPDNLDTACIIQQINTTVFDSPNNLIHKCHIVMDKQLFTSDRNPQIVKREKALCKSSQAENISLSIMMNSTKINLTFSRINNKPSGHGECVERIHHKLYRYIISSRKKKKVICKGQVSNIKLFTFGMMVKIMILLHIVQDSIQILHDYNKEVGDMESPW